MSIQNKSTRTKWLLGAGITTLIAASAQAAQISRPTDPLPLNDNVKAGMVASSDGSLGSSTGLEGHRWSYNDPTWNKAFGLANNRYGNAGHVLFAPSETAGSIPLVNVTAGTSVAATTSNMVSLPTFISSVNYANAGVVGANNASFYNVAITKPNPSSASDTVYAGVFEIPTTTYTQDTSAGGKSWYYGAALTITLSQDAHFRMGILSDFIGSTLVTYVADGFRLQDQTGISSAAYTIGYGATDIGTTSGWTPDMFFFDVDGKAGDVLTLYAANNVNNRSAMFNGVTFDVIPEPATAGLLLGLACAGMLAVRRPVRRMQA